MSFLEPQDTAVPSSSSGVEMMDSTEPESGSSSQPLSFALSNFMHRHRTNRISGTDDGATNNGTAAHLLPGASTLTNSVGNDQAVNTGNNGAYQNTSDIDSSNAVNVNDNAHSAEGIYDTGATTTSTSNNAGASGSAGQTSSSGAGPPPSIITEETGATRGDRSDDNSDNNNEGNNASSSPELVPGMWVDWLQDIRRQGLGQQYHQTLDLNQQPRVMDGDQSELMTSDDPQTTIDVDEPDDRSTTATVGSVAASTVSAAVSASDDSDVEVLMVEPRFVGTILLFSSLSYSI